MTGWAISNNHIGEDFNPSGSIFGGEPNYAFKKTISKNVNYSEFDEDEEEYDIDDFEDYDDYDDEELDDEEMEPDFEHEMDSKITA